MQIKEVQEKLKISSYTLRYYEKMGLIQPYRDEKLRAKALFYSRKYESCVIVFKYEKDRKLFCGRN